MQDIQSRGCGTTNSISVASESQLISLDCAAEEKSSTTSANVRVVYREACISQQIRNAQLSACYQLLREVGYRARRRAPERILIPESSWDS